VRHAGWLAPLGSGVAAWALGRGAGALAAGLAVGAGVAAAGWAAGRARGRAEGCRAEEALRAEAAAKLVGALAAASPGQAGRQVLDALAGRGWPEAWVLALGAARGEAGPPPVPAGPELAPEVADRLSGGDGPLCLGEAGPAGQRWAVGLRAGGRLAGALVVVVPAARGLAGEDARLLELAGAALSRAWEDARAAGARREADAWFCSVVEACPELVVAARGRAGVVYASPAAGSLLGLPPLALLGPRLARLAHPEDAEALEGLLREAQPAEAVVRLRHRDGSWRPVRARAAPLPGPGGVVAALVDVSGEQGALGRVTAQRQRCELVAELARRALAGADLAGLAEEACRALAAALPAPLVGVLEMSPGGDHLVLRAGWGWLPGVVGRALVAADPNSPHLPLDPRRPVALSRPGQGEARGQAGLPGLWARHGVRASVAAAVAARGRVWGVVSAHRLDAAGFGPADAELLDQAARVLGAAAEAQAARQEAARLHDPLTGLAGRELFLDRLAQAAARLERTGRQVGVVCVDLDGFSRLNQRLGPEAADRALALAAERLRGALRPGDSLARFGADRLVAATEGIESAHEAWALARRLVDALEPPLELGGAEVRLGASAGVAVVGRGDDPAAAVRNAEGALRRAKRGGGGTVAMVEEAASRRRPGWPELELALASGLQVGRLSLAYQPRVALDTGQVVAAEAAVRFSHPALGRVPARLLVPAAERAGLAGALGRAVLEQACRQARVLRERLGWGPAVAVRLSAPQLADPGLAGELERALQRAGLGPADLVLQVADRPAVWEPEAAGALEALGRLGLALVLEGVGGPGRPVGRLPVRAVKLDRRLVAAVGADAAGEAALEEVVAQARSAGREVIASGVDTLAQLEAVRSLGVQAGQGLVWSGPLRPPGLARWLAAGREGPRPAAAPVAQDPG